MNVQAAFAGHEFRPRILERKARLQAAAAAVPGEYLGELLAEIDAALARIDHGVFGRCDTCHDPIEPDRLQANPLTRYCLDHLTSSERKAHEEDMELAAQIQTRLLPQTPTPARDWDTHYVYQPAGPVGGDYCELTSAGDGESLFFAVGDVAGKGVAASLLMTHLSAILRSLLPLRLPLAEITSRANRLLCESTMPSHYATMACGRTAGDVVEVCNAGHCPPLLIRNGLVERLDNAGLPLGLFFDVPYETSTVRLAAGEALVLYSDGITEARDPDEADFGEAGLIESLRRQTAGHARGLADCVMADLTRFVRGAKPSDDRTLFAIRRVG
jgi:sigma-B regulation protein RsbU (phosphoserine phosphatase)